MKARNLFKRYAGSILAACFALACAAVIMLLVYKTDGGFCNYSNDLPTN